MTRAAPALLFLLLLLAGCAADDPASGPGDAADQPSETGPPTASSAPASSTAATSSTSGTASSAPSPPVREVVIQGFAFAPKDLAVHVGDTVRWTNRDGAPHSATADDGAFDTGTLGNGAAASHTFDAVGAFPYKCKVHPSMTGTVTVTVGAA